MPTALISVSDKTGIVDFARALHARDVRLLSTGGTARLLAQAGSLKVLTHSHAASASAMLLNDSALPCNWVQALKLPGVGWRSR